VADSVSNGGLEGDASRVESRKVYANELTWLEDCVHSQMFTLSRGKCKSATKCLFARTLSLQTIGPEAKAIGVSFWSLLGESFIRAIGVSLFPRSSTSMTSEI
jgi:hypothetical protein